MNEILTLVVLAFAPVPIPTLLTRADVLTFRWTTESDDAKAIPRRVRFHDDGRYWAEAASGPNGRTQWWDGKWELNEGRLHIKSELFCMVPNTYEDSDKKYIRRSIEGHYQTWHLGRRGARWKSTHSDFGFWLHLWGD